MLWDLRFIALGYPRGAGLVRSLNGSRGSTVSLNLHPDLAVGQPFTRYAPAACPLLAGDDDNDPQDFAAFQQNFSPQSTSRRIRTYVTEHSRQESTTVPAASLSAAAPSAVQRSGGSER